MIDLTAGWTNYDGAARKWHYVDDATGEARSLCGKWARNPFRAAVRLNVQPDEGPSDDDCKECRRRIDKRATDG